MIVFLIILLCKWTSGLAWDEHRSLFQSILLENLHKEDDRIVKTFLEGIEIIFIDAFVEPEYQWPVHSFPVTRCIARASFSSFRKLELDAVVIFLTKFFIVYRTPFLIFSFQFYSTFNLINKVLSNTFPDTISSFFTQIIKPFLKGFVVNPNLWSYQVVQFYLFLHVLNFCQANGRIQT